MKGFLLTTLLATAASAVSIPDMGLGPASYDGYKVFRVKTGKQLSAIQEKLSRFSAEPWNNKIDKYMDVAIAPHQVHDFQSLGLDCHVMHEDLGHSIRQESARPSIYKRQVGDDAWYDSYHPYEDHIAYWDDLQASFPNQSEKVSSGTSYEGRDIFGLHIWGSSGPGKPAILYHSTVHAREWITAMTTEYITRELINGYKAGDNFSRSVLDRYDVYVLPFVNPDGFVFSQTSNRLWRKNRQPPPANATNQTCFGRDNNRNWPFAWDANTRGASTNPCSQTYKGEAPLDTPENTGMNNFLLKLRDTQGIKLYIDWHSYGQYILSPYGYNETLYAPELGKWTKTAADAADAIRSASDIDAQYTFGPSGAVLYTTTGSSVDHAYEVGKAEFAYTIELRDTGDFGFVLPPEQIRPNVLEQFAGQRVILSYLDEVFFDGAGPAAAEVRL
ncbi:hypothetical protein BDZ85DRAFT_266534 [Elsinoe ampelina]|uniref:Peptidase M14 domain-containing protein n=1 Tax=Elsinoe ampelina TaxID=302913 RepID=A0A6A6G4P0_9PEZI|nr:hypothetical protein BDZ85DRAFT_266534 [Elsinoe ampelina]